jgi:phosphatidylglycerol lysyltransferase
VAQIGEYGLIDLPGLNFDGAQWRDLRSCLRRLPAKGYTTQWLDARSGLGSQILSVQSISNAWLARRRLPELRHSLGTLASLLEGERGQRCLLLLDPIGKAQAFMSFVPLYSSGGGYALDMLRHNPLLPRDSMLFLLATALLQFQREGHALAALGLAPLSVQPSFQANVVAGEEGSPPGEDTPLALRALRGLLWARSRRHYNFQGLAFFKRRFRPRWEPRYLVYPRLRSLPRTLRALCHVHGLRARSLIHLLAG